MKNFETSFKKSFWLYLAISLLVCIFGLFMIIFPQLSTNILFKILGVIVCISGVSIIVTHLINNKQNGFSIEIIFGIIVFVIGISLLFATESIVGFFTLFIGILFTLFSCIVLVLSVVFRDLSKAWIPLFLISISSFVLSIAIIVQGKKSLGILLGIAILLVGILSFASLIIIKSKLNKMKYVLKHHKKEGEIKDSDDSDIIEGTINEN